MIFGETNKQTNKQNNEWGNGSLNKKKCLTTFPLFKKNEKITNIF